MIQSTVAAAAFPGVFVPVPIPEIGPCWDGGITNNTPIKYAIEDESLENIFITVPFPAELSKPKIITGMGLFSHLSNLLINERLYRDLKDSSAVNKKLLSLKKLVAEGLIQEEQFLKIQQILKWRSIKVIPIRPAKELKGGSFSGLFDKNLRLNYIEQGRNAAIQAIKDL